MKGRKDNGLVFVKAELGTGWLFALHILYLR